MLAKIKMHILKFTFSNVHFYNVCNIINKP